MRPKDRLEKYLDKLVKLHEGKVVESLRSRYYEIYNRKLRVSDHISNNGFISILLDYSDRDNYIIYGRSTGNVTVLNYEQVKAFVKTLFCCGFILTELQQPLEPFKSDGTYTQQVEGFLVTNFSKKQLSQMSGFLKGRGNRHWKKLQKLSE